MALLYRCAECPGTCVGVYRNHVSKRVCARCHWRSVVANRKAARTSARAAIVRVKRQRTAGISGRWTIGDALPIVSVVYEPEAIAEPWRWHSPIIDSASPLASILARHRARSIEAREFANAVGAGLHEVSG